MKHSFFLIVLLAVHFLSFCQQQSFDEYYVGVNGDTIKGQFPSFRQGDRNPAEVVFMSSDNKQITLTVQNCRLFDVKGEDRFVAYHGARMINSIDELATDPSSSENLYDTIHAFLKVIYIGKDATLYSYKDKVRQNYFYQLPGAAIIELENKAQEFYTGEGRKIGSTNKFREQLKEVFASQIESKQLQTRLTNLSFSERELVRFMNFIGATSLPAKVNKYPARLIIGAGAAFNALKIAGADTYFETQIKHTASTSAVFVLGARFTTKRSQGRLLISPTIRLYSFSAEGDIDLTSGLANYNHASEFKSKLIVTTSANIGYMFISQPTFKWYASAGPGYAFLSGSKEVQTTSYTNAPSTVIQYKPVNMIFVVNAETGITIGDKINCWLNYQPPANTSRLLNKSVKFSSLQAGISLLLKAGK